ncbi:Ras-related protein Rab-1A [Yasminevirus sp. GU-2018]|uniref:Ras-related protein Rab-1A n=1 Tax=Yasminevirus sp. GU-2018 TaxID=2420051 RepID=A0A5K0UBA7_9VIRU|nr:Ras-related protein Rab-1A [Yasminevirus sp. GU-2018]
MSRHHDEYDYLIKIVVVGDSGVGKSALLTRFADGTYTDTYVSTIGVDFKMKTVDIDGKVVKIQMWDTAGQERFRAITAAYYRGCNGVMFVFDISSRESLDSIAKWRSEVEKYASDKQLKVQCVLVGNKSDLDHRAVSSEKARQVADLLEMEYFETSARLSDTVDDAFTFLARSAVQELTRQRLSTNMTDNTDDGSRRLNPSKPIKVSKCC